MGMSVLSKNFKNHRPTKKKSKDNWNYKDSTIKLCFRKEKAHTFRYGWLDNGTN